MNMCSSGWGPNFDNTKALIKTLGLDVPVSGEKMPLAPFGSVFWFRVRALEPLFTKGGAGGWQHDDFPPEPLPQDGTISHAIERVYPFVAQGAGYYPAEVMSVDFAVAPPGRDAGLCGGAHPPAGARVRLHDLRHRRHVGGRLCRQAAFRAVPDLWPLCEQQAPPRPQLAARPACPPGHTRT